MLHGHLFSNTSQAIFYNFKEKPVQRMLDFDFICGRSTPSIAGIVQPGSSGGFHKMFFGQTEIAIPIHSRQDTAAISLRSLIATCVTASARVSSCQ